MKLQYIEHCGRQLTLKQLASETGIRLYTLYQRWHRGDRNERLVRPALQRKRTAEAA
jgi:hypothetical protein